MPSNSVELPIQNDQPKVVFLFGAGASYGDGVPLQADLVPLFLRDDDPQLQRSEIGNRVRNFLIANFSCNDQCPTLEEVFGFLNYLILNDLSLSKEWTVAEMIRIKSDLAKLIHYLVSKSTSKSLNFGKFWQTIARINKRVGVISTNYDTLLDESFDQIYNQCLIDYCLDLVNYRYSEESHPFNWWVNPAAPTQIFNSVVPTRIKLIKLHGSLNWKYCNCCGQVLLTPWQHQLNLKMDSFESFLEGDVSSCALDGNKLASLIQVPTHTKINNNYIFNRLYDEASYLVRQAERLIIIGYSFPEADVHIRALIRRNFSERGEIVVINPSEENKLKSRYETLARNIRYLEIKFEQFIESGKLDELLIPRSGLHADMSLDVC